MGCQTSRKIHYAFTEVLDQNPFKTPLIRTSFGQDNGGSLLDSDLPNINASHEALLDHQVSGSSSGQQAAPDGGMASAAGVMSFKLLCFLDLKRFLLETTSAFDHNFGENNRNHQLLRLCFPTVVANASPLSVLPQFVEVLGKKLDKITSELDPLHLKSNETFGPSC